MSKIEFAKEIKKRIPEELKKQLIQAIQQYFLDERGEEIGELSAGLLLDFMLNTTGPLIYNQAIRDACAFMTDKAEDMHGLEKRER